jgi:uncharacterized MAPEG superfamily protein
VGIGKPRSQGGYDNHEPRDWLPQAKRLARARQRAQANSFEALPFFIGAVIIAHQLGARRRGSTSWPCCSSRCASSTSRCTSSRPGTARSAVWALAFLVNIAILFLAR